MLTSIVIELHPYMAYDNEYEPRSPNTKVICVKTDPTESPRSISPYPLQQETIELAISGKSVPIDTNTRPIIIEETPNAEAT